MQKRLRDFVPDPVDKDQGRAQVKQPDKGWAILGLTSHGIKIDKPDGQGDAGNPNIWYFNPTQRQDYLTEFNNNGFLMKFFEDEPVKGANPVIDPTKVSKKRPMKFNEMKKDKILELLRKHGQDATANGIALQDFIGTLEEMHPQDLFAQQYKTFLDEEKKRIGQSIWKQGMDAVKDSIVAEEKAWGAGPRIFVMEGNGFFYVGKAINGKFHHSSFLAGGSVAAAGEIVVADGKIKMISNVSGHYKPGAAFLWQAVSQLQLNLPASVFDEIVVDIVGAGRIRARDFLQDFSPLEKNTQSDKYLPFDPQQAAIKVKEYIKNHNINPPAQGGNSNL